MHQMKKEGVFVLVVKLEPRIVILSFCKLNSCQHQGELGNFDLLPGTIGVSGGTTPVIY